MTTLIKCCGMSRSEDIVAVNAAQPDFCGFVVDVPRSHRSVTPEQAHDLREQLANGIAAVGVFVNMEPKRVVRISSACHFDAVQLHGNEDETYIAHLRTLTETPIIRAFRVRTARDLEAARASHADFVLLDNGQGTGVSFDWSLLDCFGRLDDFARPCFLAGGLTPDNIPEAIERLHPYAIDISSGIETGRRKDPDKISQAVNATRRAS